MQFLPNKMNKIDHLGANIDELSKIDLFNLAMFSKLRFFKIEKVHF